MNKVRGVRGNRFVLGGEKDWDVEMDDMSGIFSLSGNAIPGPSGVQQPRSFYASRFFEQALPLEQPEAPLFRNLDANTGRSWDYRLGEFVGARRAKADATVSEVSPDHIRLRHDDGSDEDIELFNLFPGNRKSLTHNTALVKPGQRVAAGSLLAKSNFTDDEGRLALGRNARIAVVPFKGKTMDDAVAISAAFATAMTSDHAETIESEKDDTLKFGKNHFVSLYPDTFVKEQLSKLGDDGIVRKGEILRKGDPIMLRTRPRTISSENVAIGNISRASRFQRKDASMLWEGDDDAEVVDVAKTRDGGVKVLVRYKSPVRAGDKLVLRSGSKGTVSEIVPDEKMPRTEDGQPVDMLFNQLGLPSRVNAIGFYEMMLSKVAKKTGRPYVLPPFTAPDDSWDQLVARELEKHGVPAEERLYDPEEGRFLDEPVAIGIGHILKLHHQAANKISTRGNSRYTLDRQPMKGAEGQAQRLSALEMSVLHSSGATNVQKEGVLLRGEMRDDYWRQVRANRTPAKLDKPFVWDKFQALLAGAGVNVRDLGHGRLRLVPMTEKELDARGAVEIANDGILDLSTMEPKKGGLFDPVLTRDKKWGFVKLPEPMVNPSYEATVRTLLGLTQKEYEALLDER